MSVGAAPLMELDHVSHEYRVGRGFWRSRRLRAVDDVSLRVEKGDILGIVGESGCGKTTLSRIMLGLIAPSAGSAAIEGRRLDEYGRRPLARRIQLVFQDPYSSLNPRRSIGSIVSQPLRVHGIGDRREREARSREMLALVGLPSNVVQNVPAQLSGGQRQRVVIARALILRPEILVCDEPTSALDVSVQAQILNLLLDLRRELGLTYVLISHNLAVIAHMATSVAVMYLGRVVESAGTERLFRDPQHPYTKVLLRSVMTPAPRGGLPDLHLGSIPSPFDLPPGCRFHTRCPEAIDICRREAPPSVPRDGGFVECHLASAAGR